jgi:membrane protease subunit HflK
MKKKIDDIIEQSLKTASVYIKWMAVMVLVIILLSGVTFIKPGEVAMVRRLGKLVGDTKAEQIHQPGLHFNLPFLIDKVVRVPIQKVHEIRIDSLYTLGNISDITETGYALTGDDNIVLLDAVLKYKIIDPIQYAFGIENPELNIKEIATGAMTQEVASTGVDDILTKKKMEIGNGILQAAQQSADQIGLGIQVIAIEFITLQPPQEVKDVFELVTGTSVQNETMIQEAMKYKEKVILEATAERDSLIQRAKASKIERIAQANFEVAQFYGVIKEYQKNPQVVRRRLYREKVENILQDVAKTVLAPEGANSENIIIP